MVAKISPYEQCRLKRVEENRKRMEALNLPLLSQALHNGSSLKPSPMKPRKRTVEKKMVVLRRSKRFTDKSDPVYKEIDVSVEPKRVFKGRDFSDRLYASDEARAEAVEKAEKLVSGLEPGYPVFIRSMLPSHVSGGFWLGLPVPFCKKNLPSSDVVMTLIDENGEEYPNMYLARKPSLSGGWKGFAVAHDLVDGDAVVFHLIRRTTFKVYIVRVNRSELNPWSSES